MLNEVLTILEKWYLQMQKLIKTVRNKKSGGCIFQISIRCTFKTWNTMLYFSFDFDWYFINLDIVR